MVVTAHHRGHSIYAVGNEWRYASDHMPVDDDYFRACGLCGKEPLENGEDACLGRLEGVLSACCGHGKEPGYIMRRDGRRVVTEELPQKAVP